MSKIGKTVLILLAIFALASSGWAADEIHMPGRTDNVPPQLFGQPGPWVGPRSDDNSLDLETIVWVDDSWTSQGDVDLFNNTLVWNTNAFDKIQEGIDAVAAGGTVNVLPGTYLESATGRYVLAPSGQGPHQFGLFIDINHNGIIVRGVDAVGIPVTSFAGVLANVALNATNDFGPSGLFIEGDDVTVTGFNLMLNDSSNKCVEVIGDNLTFKYNVMTDGTSLYFNDWRFDTMGDVSWLQSYLVEGNYFGWGTSVDFASGAGYSGMVSGRQIINNTFAMTYVNETWPAISFNGSGTGVPWFVQSVGAAVISGNTFSGAEQLYIRHRGTVNYGDFDWPTYWTGNTYDKKVIFGSNPPTVQGSYNYTFGSYTYNNVKEIGANIQREIDRAASGDIVLCGNGNYVEAPNIYKSLTLKGESQAGVVINASSFNDYGIDANGDYNFGFQSFTLDGPDAALGGNYGLKISGNSATAAVSNVTVYGSYKTGIDLNGVASGTITNCTSTGAVFGNGLSLTDCDNITINGLTTSGNAWGGAAVYTKGAAYPPGGSNGVTFTGTLSLSEARPLYTEKDPPSPAITNLTVPTGQFPYVVGNATYPLLEAYMTSQANAVAAAVAVGANGWAYHRSSDYFYVASTMKIQAAVNAAASPLAIEATGNEIHVAAGTYTESVNVNKYVKIIGEETVLATLTTVTSSTGPVFTIAASGLNVANPLLFQDLQVLPVGYAGFDVGAGSWSYIKLDNVHVVGTNPTNPNAESEIGITIWNAGLSSPSLSYLDIVDSEFRDLTYGWMFQKLVGAYSDNVTNVTVTGTSFTHNAVKGIYAEKLSNATFTGCEVNNNGWLTSFWNSPWNAGFDFNLKGIQAYTNIFLNYCDFEGNATGTTNGAALMVKARGSGGDPSYDANPASLSNVQVKNCKIVGNERGVRFGEPGKANTSPANSIVYECAVYGNAVGDVINASTAAQNAAGNWWGTATPNWATQVVGSNVNHTPWLGVNGTYPNPGFDASTGGLTLSLEDPFIGCVASSPCNEDLLHITTDQAGLVNLRAVFQLPANFALVDPTNGSAMPTGTVDAQVEFATVNALPNDSFEVNIFWDTPYSSGNSAQRIASVPIKYTGAATGTYSITGVSSLYNDGINYIGNALALGSVNINVDCADPAIDAFSNSATCSFGSFAQLVDKLHATFSKGTGAGASDLDEAWVQFGLGGPTLTVFTANTGTSPYSVDFPGALAPTAWYTNLTLNGCTDLYLYVKDVECNVSDPTMITVGRDELAPGLSVGDAITGCYNMATGAAALQSGLDIDVTGLTPLNCRATTGTLTITSVTNPGGTPYTLPLTTDLSNFPGATYYNALWLWMLASGQGNVPAGANGETYTFSVTVNDCAGNVSGAQTWDICLDFSSPGIGAVTTFDARPADAGVWLNWAWTPNASQAVEMRIYRSPWTPNGTFPAGYPGYNPQLLNTYDTSPAAFSGWDLVITQTIGGLDYSSNDTDPGDNNARGDYHRHLTYWLDAKGGWVNGDAYPDFLPGPLPNPTGPDALSWRDIYRYVTFVKDAGGNWSTGYTPTALTNADHATNYWLGDFAPADAGGYNNSRGKVDTDDLALLSVVYFSNGTFENIGPVQVENGNIGKGVPIHGGATIVNFFDLVPFSFNYNMVGRYGNPLEYSIEPDPTVLRPFTRLDGMPVVDMAITDDPSMTVGSEFVVNVALANTGGVVKAAEALLKYNETMLEVVSSTIGNASTAEGTLFAKVAETATKGEIGLVAASCGGWTTLDGDATLGTVTFRVKSEISGSCEIELTSVQMVDNTGEIIEIEGETITLFNAPTLPDRYALYQNYPNPFNPTTNIQFDLKDAGLVKILVYNTLGQVVATAVDRDFEAGRHTVSFDASHLASGLYLYSINVNGFTDLKKMVLIR